MAQQTSEDRIRTLVDTFVEELTAEIRNSAMESVAAAIGGMVTTTTRRKPGPKATKGATKTTRKRRGPGRKQRSSISSEALLKAIEKAQGERTEVIARGLGVSAKSFKPVLDELVGSGTVIRKGKARGTTLHIG